MLLLPLLFACAEPPLACDTSAAASVMLTLSASDGGDLSAATAEYRPEGGDWTPCDHLVDQWTCGYEVAGVIAIRAAADGYDPNETEVTVAQGECHVVGEQVALTLERSAVDCTDEEVPSVLATVVGSSDEELTGIAVTYTVDGGAVAACEPHDAQEWACGAEIPGEFAVTAAADGHVPETLTVTVGADECHVITELLAFELDWMED